MLRPIKFAVVASILSLLAACGGGGGGASTGPIASSLSFDLLAIYKKTYTSTSSKPFTVTGTSNGSAVTGSGTVTNGQVTPGTFESETANQKTITVTGSGTTNGKNFSFDSSYISWTDSNYLPKGFSGGDEYIVVTGTVNIPTTARVNDTGTAFTANRYTDSSKTTRTGTMIVSYVVEADTETTALLTLISTYKDLSGTTTKNGSGKGRVTQTNTYTAIEEKVNDYKNNTYLTVTY
jgi:hypothetical protein